MGVAEGFAEADFSAAISAVTSAFGDPTRREIYLFARQSERGVTAAEVAERFDVHPNVARHHLDKLAAGGYVEVRVERHEGGGAGRPSKRYEAVGEGLPFQVRRDDLLVSLLTRMIDLVPPAQVEAMAEQVGEDYGRALAESMAPGESHRSFRMALSAVADALTAHGFAAHAEPRGKSLAIISEHCPFGEVAVQHPVICAVDRGLVRGMLGRLYGDTMPRTEACRPAGDEVCVTTLSS